LNNLWQKKNSPLQKMNTWIELILEKRGKIGAIKRALGIEDSDFFNIYFPQSSSK